LTNGKTLARPAARRRGASANRLDTELVKDVVAANRTLARLGVLDAFGHVTCAIRKRALSEM